MHVNIGFSFDTFFTALKFKTQHEFSLDKPTKGTLKVLQDFIHFYKNQRQQFFAPVLFLVLF